jgi:glycosyltransferase involved in cell wall biosynthesis
VFDHAGVGGGRPAIFISHPSDLLTDHLPNGDGLVAFGFIRELAARGTRLHIAYRRIDLRQELPGNVTLHAVPSRFANPALDRLHYMLATRRLLHRLRRAAAVELVHQMNPVFVGLSLALVGCGLPVVLGTYVARWPGGEIHDEGSSRLRQHGIAAVRWLIMALQQLHATALLVTTPAALNRIAMPKLASRKIVTMRHGVDHVMFAPANPPAPAGDPSILFYSHLDRRKGVFVLLEAFRKLAPRLPEARLVLAGRGEHEAELRDLIAAYGLGRRIELLGLVPRADAPALLRAHSVYCLPSFGEPYATTVLEAMACACPIVISDAGGLPHMVPPDGGLRVPAGDAEALATALETVLRAPELQAAMGRANRAHIERYHTWPRIVDALEQTYAQIRRPQAGKRPVAQAVAS